MITATYLVLAAAATLFGYRMIVGPTLADRINALSGMLIAGMGAIATQAVDTGRGAFLPVLVVVALVSFVGTAMVARFIEGRGR
ncbi:MAG: monovalent cation/H+ antiporter complex subunit F [Acidimicrobiia bacterium]